ncbi:unnamed protein product [Spirodela intermedia]|uniref:Uncharacterized protein n=1 Tax=Spirodela intermedia TaxID=51605 RepID=A0A7I8INZ3_SPIIN|nr:unnamed protein product [Spirodela intermedia]CAA6659626.1 unnamed protein product [Spirodela intermedia]
MDATTSGTGHSVQYHNIVEKPLSLTFQRQQRHCFGESTPGTSRWRRNPPSSFMSSPAVIWSLRTSPASRPATCSFFRKPANYPPDCNLSIAELAALDMCRKRAIFKSVSPRKGRSSSGEACCRREKSLAIAGPGHSIAVTSGGQVYSFGSNSSGQLGHGTLEEEWKPRLIRTMLISDQGHVYAFGKDSFGEGESGAQGSTLVTTPRPVESLKHIFVGTVYTFSWGSDARLGHQTEPNDLEPHPLLGALEDIPVVQIAAGYCYLLLLTCQPSGIIYKNLSTNERGSLPHPYSSVLAHIFDLQVCVFRGLRARREARARVEDRREVPAPDRAVPGAEPAADGGGGGAWHAAVVGRDGRVCTWGWGRYGCLGHGNEDCESVPKVVESLLPVKASHVATGDYTTFVVSDAGDVYSFGCGESSSLGHSAAADDPAAAQGNNRHANVLRPELVASLKEKKERVVQISLTNSIYWNAHTFALTESGRLYAFGAGDKGQLGVELADQTERAKPERVDVDLS